jgi:hypothetical protein
MDRRALHLVRFTDRAITARPRATADRIREAAFREAALLAHRSSETPADTVAA